MSVLCLIAHKWSRWSRWKYRALGSGPQEVRQCWRCRIRQFRDI